jgi:hypothetical protein
MTAGRPASVIPAKLDRKFACLALRPFALWREGDQRMKIMTVACALGTALVLCNLGISDAEARARKARVVDEQRLRVDVPVLRPTPWDYNIVPRYRYRPEDDRVDPYGPPLVSSYVRYEGWRWPYWW